MFLFKVLEETAEKWAIVSLMRKQFSSQRHEWIVRFVRENRQMANRKLYREDVLQMLFADSDSEGEYFPFGNDDRPSNDRASPGTSLQRNGAAVQGERVHEAQTSDHLTLCPTGMGVAGVDVVVVSIGELLISELTERRWLRAAVLMIGQIASFFLIAALYGPPVQVQSVWGWSTILSRTINCVT